jgi:uncharacterized damage-inducible protein DinB
MNSKLFFQTGNQNSLRVEKLILMLEETRNRLLEQLEGLSQETLDYTPSINKIETIGTLLFHIAAVEWSYIFEDIDKLEMGYEEWKYAFALREKLDPAQLTGEPLKFYFQKLSDVRNDVIKRLKKLEDNELERFITIGKRELTIEWILYHLIYHESIHIGQINFLKRQHKVIG